MELIDREDICSVDICRDIDCEKCLFFQPDGVCLLRARVFKLKAVDAVPVVRCENCIYFQQEQVRTSEGTYRNKFPNEGMVSIKEISYEEARKEFFENMMIHKQNQLSYWLRKHDHYKCSELAAEIGYIEDAMKALERKTDENCNFNPV